MGNFLTRYREDSIWTAKGAVAFVIAPLVPAIFAAEFIRGNHVNTFAIAAAIAYLHELILGVPLAFMLNRYKKISLITTFLGSFLIGAIPYTCLVALTTSSGFDGSHRALTQADYSDIYRFFLESGLFGLSAGIAWWLCVVPYSPDRKPAP